VFPVPSYSEYLMKNNLEHSESNLADFTAYATRFRNLEEYYFSLLSKLGLEKDKS
jgi:Tfp pilus assembly protein PilE